MNELSKETSPYLLQHANNPVHWKAWNAQSLELAKSQDKLIILSSGYSACHWCHVMEHESFENDEVADVMNRSFISIKVDREERPDIDAVYMKAVQIMTGQGGWP
ncbi:MAG: thioredoxin domain-containing protein, partial [Flavobacterium sp.]